MHRIHSLALLASLAIGCTPPAPTPPQTPQGTSSTVREDAVTGVGKKGRNYGSDPISTPIQALHRSKERLALAVEIPKGLQMFEAVEGRKPNSHDEFMEKIVKANQIQLPELPTGDVYVYDPQTGKLMVDKKVP